MIYRKCGIHRLSENYLQSNKAEIVQSAAKGKHIMIKKIKSLKPLDNYKLLVSFDDGKVVLYDVLEDISSLPGYMALKTTHGLFMQVKLDSSRTCVYWNSDIDLPSDTIYEY